MCGIAGFYQTDFDFTKSDEFLPRLESMKNSLLHRGPDSNDIFLSAHAGLAHARLSIIDLKGGRQPMKKGIKIRNNARNHTGNQIRTAVISYNGEIYNSLELKRYLTKYRLNWSTTSDTEIIINGYLAEGLYFFQKLNGIFAFAIYDVREDCMILVRDRLGVKPLFYCETNKMLIFGSEQKALFAYGIKPAADKVTWGEIFGTGPAHTLGNGVFSGISEVLPGHMIVAKGNGKDFSCKDMTYWRLTAKEHTDSLLETEEKVSALVYDSVKRQMVSDIPICTFLSGGLDSSLVSAICAKELKKQGKTLNTYSFDFVNNDKNFKANAFQSSQDRPFAEIMVKHIGSNHTFLECNNVIQADYLYKAVDARDIPCMADVESSLLYFCSEVAKHQKVAITGECADEIFGGYPWFHKKEMFEKKSFPWSHDMSARTCLLKDEFINEIDAQGYAQKVYNESIAETPALAGEDSFEARRREISWLNIRWFMMTLLNRMDRTSMYSGLEARVPYADHRILEYVYNIPWEMKCHENVTKSLLIAAGKNLLPNEVLHRKKSPYPKTYDPEYEYLLKSRMLDILSSPNEPIHSIIDKEKVISFMNTDSDYGRPWYGQLMAGPQMIAYMLQVNYWMKKYGIK